MEKTRLEAFSDGVLAIIITIMVLEIKIPQGHELEDLIPLIPVFLSYVMSFVYVGIYWGNHHHLLQTTHKVNSGIMLANLHLLFWLSLVPLTTEWVGETHFSKIPMAFYGINLFLAASAYYLLQKAVDSSTVKNQKLRAALKKHQTKGYISQVLYLVGIVLAFFQPYLSFAIFFIVAIIWIIPAKEIEKVLG